MSDHRDFDMTGDHTALHFIAEGLECGIAPDSGGDHGAREPYCAMTPAKFSERRRVLPSIVQSKTALAATIMPCDHTSATDLVAQWLSQNSVPTWVDRADLVQEADVALCLLERKRLPYMTRNLRYKVVDWAIIDYLRREGKYHDLIDDQGWDK